MASVGSIIGGGLSVVRERPGAVAIWGVTYVGGIVALFIMVALLMGGTIGMMGMRDPAAAGSAIGGMILTMIVFYLGMFFLAVVLMNAVFRTVLRPNEWSMASLRVGMDELRVFGLTIMVLIGTFIISFVAGLLISLISLALMAVTGPNIAVGIVVQLIYLCFWIWLSVRLSLLSPVVFYRRRFAVDTAWEMTGGANFWKLLGAFLVIGLVVMVVFGAIFWWAFGPIFMEMMQHPRDPVAMRSAMEAFGPAAMMGRFGIVFLVSVLFGPIAFAIWNGMLATATREFLIEGGEVLEDDAEGTAAIFE
jgi:hypothetical protein